MSVSLQTSDEENKKKIFWEQLNKFIMDNNIIGTAAGVSIALITKDVIQSLVSDIIFPAIIFMLIKLNIKDLTKILPRTYKFDFKNFMKEFVSWVFIVILTFVFVKVAFEKILGIDQKNQQYKKSTL